MKRLPKLLNKLIVWFQLNEVKGKYSLYKLGLKLNLGRYLIKHSYHKNTHYGHKADKDAERLYDDFFVPWDQWCFWLEKGPQNYYPEDIQPVVKLINNIKHPIALIDLGADIGVITKQLTQACPRIQQVICLEPNPKSFDILQLNLPQRHITHLNKAISNYEGFADLHCQSQLASDHEGFISKSAQGKTHVTTLDTLSDIYQLNLFNTLLLKIDVEGQEIATFEGGTSLIKNTPQIIVLVELHPDVLARDKTSAEAIFNAAEAIRAFNWYIPDSRGALHKINRQLPFFEVHAVKQYDVIGITEVC